MTEIASFEISPQVTDPLRGAEMLAEGNTEPLVLASEAAEPEPPFSALVPPLQLGLPTVTPGMEGRLAGGLLASGECRICIRKLRS